MYIKNKIKKILKKILLRISMRTIHSHDCLPLLKYSELSKKYVIGDYSYGNPIVYDYYKGGTEKDKNNIETQRHQKIIIGKFCSIANDVCFLLNVDHRPDWISTYPFSQTFSECSAFKGHPYSKGDIIIGNDVWIGRGATVLSGVTIGNGAVIGCEAVISKNVEPYSIYVGNPQKLIKYRFSKQEIVQLNTICWWNWDIQKIKKAIPILMSGKISDFIKQYS